MKGKLLFSAIAGASILLASCGGSDSDDPISATDYALISGTVNPTVSTTDVVIDGKTVRYIAAVALENNQVMAVSSMIGNTGNFSLNLLKDKNYSFMLLDQNGIPVYSTERKTYEVRGSDNVNVNISDIDGDGFYEVSILVQTGNLVEEDYPDFVDSNNNGIPDNIENIDYNNNGKKDILEFFADNDNDGLIDAIEDNNYNGIPDLIEDINRNGKLDIFEDTDNDGIRDGFEYIHQYTYNDVQNNTRTTIITLPVEELSDVEKEALIYMWNEEKMAKDLYYSLYEKYQQYFVSNTFKNIAERSETTHQELMEILLDKYQLSIDDQPYDPNRDLENDYPRGEYSLQDIKDLYEDLLTQGSQSLEEALKVGCIVEVVDVEDLNEEIAKIDNQDLILAFENLRQGSYNHYWAFDNALKTIGIEEGCCVLGDEYCKTPEEFPVSNKGNMGMGNGGRR